MVAFIFFCVLAVFIAGAVFSAMTFFTTLAIFTMTIWVRAFAHLFSPYLNILLASI